MNLKELNFPVRVYWDLSPIPHNIKIDYLRICEEIMEVKILKLDLLDTGHLLSHTCIGILEKLTNENVAVSLTMSGSAVNSSSTALLSNLNVKALFIEVGSFDELRSSVERINPYNSAIVPVGISFNSGRTNYKDLPGILSFCLNREINYFVLPMQRLLKPADCFYVDRNESEELALRLNRINHENMKLTIHDPFLWRIFYPLIQFPEGGCQAANSMVYISPDIHIYPCPSMPVSLGNLMVKTLKEILLDKSRSELRKHLIKPPEGCIYCEELSKCMGGCRGRSYVLNNSFNDPDPACKKR